MQQPDYIHVSCTRLVWYLTTLLNTVNDIHSTTMIWSCCIMQIIQSWRHLIFQSFICLSQFKLKLKNEQRVCAFHDLDAGSMESLTATLFKIQSKHFQRAWIFQGYFAILFFKYCVSVYSRPQWRDCESNICSVHKNPGLVIYFICQKWKIWIKQCKYRLKNWTFTCFKSLNLICCMKEHPNTLVHTFSMFSKKGQHIVLV